MQNRLRVGIIGSGFGLYGHWAALAQLSDFNLIAVCGSKFTLDHAKNVYKSEDWPLLLKEHELDFVVICVPPSLQTEILLQCMDRKIMTMVEKPLCSNDVELSKIKNKLAKYAVPSLASFIFPELATWRNAADIITTRKLGKIRSINMNWQIESYSIRNRLINWKNNTSEGGSALFHFAPHFIQAAMHFGGTISKISGISTSVNDLGPTFGEPICSIHGIFESGAFLSINTNLSAPFGTGVHIEISCEFGTLVLRNTSKDFVTGFELKAESNDFFMDLKEIDAGFEFTFGADSRVVPLMKLYKKFYDSVASSKTSAPSLRDAILVQSILHSVQESDKMQKWIALPKI